LPVPRGGLDGTKMRSIRSSGQGRSRTTAPAISGQSLARNGIILMRGARNVKQKSQKKSIDKKFSKTRAVC
jgi:hypothetical protein